MRFLELLSDINNQQTDKEGKKGNWIKAVKHSRMYNSHNPNHNDLKGWRWFNEVMNRYQSGDIIIYKIGNRNWFVLPAFENEFKKNYQNAYRK